MGYLFSFIYNQKNKKWNHTNLNELTSYFSPKRGSHKFIDILSKEFLRPYPLNYYCLLWIPTHFSKLKTYLIYLFKSPLLSSQHKQRGWKIFTVEKISFLHHLCIFIQHNSKFCIETHSHFERDYYSYLYISNWLLKFNGLFFYI